MLTKRVSMAPLFHCDSPLAQSASEGSSPIRGEVFRMRLSALILMTGCLLAYGQAARAEEPAATPAPVSFTKDVAPIFVQKCQACHGPGDPKGDYQITTFELLSKPGASSSAAVTAG